jgi:hypothetical protein
LKSKITVGLAFIAGGIVFNIPWAVSNAPTTEDVIGQAMAGAMQSYADYQKKREDEHLDSLPNIMDCQNMEWMKNCSEINKAAKKNPNAPVRVTNAKGLEFNFVPGTPSPIIKLQLEQTPEAAKAAVMYMDSSWGEYKKAAGLYKAAMWEAGPLENIIGLDKAKQIADAPKAINSGSLALSVFVHSMCGACEVQLQTMAKLKERYPALKISVFMFDQNPEGFKAKVTDRGLTGRMLSAEETQNALRAGVDKWPTTWIDNMQMKQRESLSGVKSIVQVEERLQGISQIISANK